MSDKRFIDIISESTEENIKQADVVILDVPTDEGIKRNGGRPGASLAPDAIRAFLHKLTTNFSPDHKPLDTLRIIDSGNITGATLEEIHETARKKVEEYISKGKIVIALGGGHDVTYPLATGFYSGINKEEFSLINIDAHLDVREKKSGLHHSGSSFRLLIEDKTLRGSNFTEFGIQPFSYSKEHYDWVVNNGATVIFYDKELIASPSKVFEKKISSIQSPLYITFDIDSVRSADAPGCSAPSPIGFSSEDAIAMCFATGKHSSTRMLDIVEVSPPYDIDDKTSRLAARMIAAFLTGLANR